MRATFVGTGTAFTRKYGHTNVLVEAGETRLMVDFGFFSPLRLHELGRSLAEITHVAISHIHADHVGGLEELAFMSRFVLGTRTMLLLPAGLAAAIWETSLRGGLEWTADEDGAPLQCTLHTYFDSLVLDAGWTEVGAIAVKAFAVDHVPGKASYGFLVRERASGEQIIFGCDVRRRLRQLESEPTPEEFARGPVVHDCQLFDDGPSGVHIPFEQLLAYPASVRERLVLVHYNDSIIDELPKIRAAGFKVMWPGDVIELPASSDTTVRAASG